MKYILYISLVLLFLASAASAERITLASGNAPIGERDPLIHVSGKATNVNGWVYSAADIESQQALVINRNHDWTNLAGSNWIGVADGELHSSAGGYSYIMHFNMSSTDQASILLSMSSDNWGQAYLNGNWLGMAVDNALPSHSQIFVMESSEQSFFREGDNVLEFEVGNSSLPAGYTNPSGLIFKAQVDYVPEPASIATLAIGLAGIGFGWRRRSNRN